MLKKLSLLVLLLASTLSWARIIETKNVAAILSEIDADTLVFFDIDQTTITPTTALGSRAWWEHFQNKVMAADIIKEQIFPHIIPWINQVARNTPQQLVEPEIAALIRSLQERGITVWALTGRHKVAPWDPHYGEATREQLFSFGIDFERSTPPTGVQFDEARLPVSYAYGILFTDGKQKGPVLKDFLQALDHRPTKVVMIDDLISFLNSIEESMSREGIPFVGFHYTRLAHLDDQFDPLVANIQMHSLLSKGHMPADSEAQLIKADLLSKNPSLSTDFYLDELLIEWKEHLSKNTQGGTHATTRY